MRWFDAEEHQPFHFESGAAGALLIHGFMGTPAEMRPLGHALAEAGISAHGVLLPGFGPDIERLEAMRARDWIQAAASAWEEVRKKHSPATLIGFSMGGAVALHLAAENPPDWLVLLAPLWRLLSGDWRVRLLPLARYVMRPLRPFEAADFQNPEVRTFFAEAMPGVDLDDPAVQHALRNEVRLSPVTLDELRRVASAAGRAAERVTAPTLVIQGTDDRTVTPADTRRLAARLNGSTALREVPAGHQIVRPEEKAWPTVRDLVVRFTLGGAP